MAASSPTELHLPASFPYPIKLISLDAAPQVSLQRGTRLLSYSFVYLPNSPNAQPETRFGTWDSAIEGTLSAWKVAVGDVISQKKAKDRPVVVVLEPCKHGIQLGGLCVLCGKDMTNVDYTGFSDASRASIQMTHSAFGPTVSLEEAQRIERETADHLLKSRKLSLIVDLDQTIVHATVDPTVGEWITEGEAWEARQAKKPADAEADSSAPPPKDDPEDTDDECNPNWEALKDVKRFRLGPESFGSPSSRGDGGGGGGGAQKGKGKHKLVENEGCMYYIKPRPGWKDFLRETATKYEMHVYTMGTRAYAEEVCAAIDPDGNIFGGRLLSRDESGSLTQKSLQRLFPCDTSMVVIIDDRADVWEWSPNLVKVIPYDFFVGIGDINSSFLPKIEPLTAAVPITPPKSAAPSTTVNGLSTPSSSSTAGASSSSSPSAASSSTTSPTTVDTSPASPTGEESDLADTQTTVMLTQNNAALDAQLEERPLAKKQEELQEHEHDAEVAAATASVATAHVPSRTATPPSTPVKEPSVSPKPEKPHRKALLKNDDYELQRLGKLLNEIHSRFFGAYEGRRKTGHRSKSYDVTRIIPRLRSEVFEGVHILFSSVIPLDMKPEATEVWKMAHMFGARCSTELTGDITHVVAAKRGTVKVDMARKRGGIKIVWLAWFTDSISLWQRQDEKPYLLDDPPALPAAHPPLASSSSPIDAAGSSSSDLDIDSDEWDQDPPATTAAAGGAHHQHHHDGKDPGALELESINWDDINDEVEAAMNESDDDDDGEGDGDGDGDGDDARSERSYSNGGMASGNASDNEEWVQADGNSVTGGSVGTTTPRRNRKRPRSATPSDSGGGGTNGSTADDDDEYLRSPLAKRKKLAADRTGYSRLKEGITADELGVAATAAEDSRSTPTPFADAAAASALYEAETASNGTSSGSAHPSPKAPVQDEMDEDDSDDDDDDDSTEDSEEEEAEEDDFLAKALEEEWG